MTADTAPLVHALDKIALMIGVEGFCIFAALVVIAALLFIRGLNP